MSRLKDRVNRLEKHVLSTIPRRIVVLFGAEAKRSLAGKLTDEDLGLQAGDTLVIFNIPRPAKEELFV